MRRISTLVAVIAALSFSTAAYAMLDLPPGVEERTTYTDVHGEIVGQYQINCDGTSASWGTISGYNYIEYGTC